MSKVVSHTPVWEPTQLPYNAAGNTKPGFECAHMLENGNGKCSGNVFTLDQAIGDHCCIVMGWTPRDLWWRLRTWNWRKGGQLKEYS
jgi:hypothetical protein